MRTEFNRLLKQVRRSVPNADLQLLRRAYRVANEAHEGAMRDSGAPYVSHCIAVARNLVQIGMGSITVTAGLLHDVLEDTPVTREELVREFGEEIAALVDGVSKIKTMRIQPAISRQQKQADNLRKMLIATAKDLRVILIKLADRLHNMRTIEFLEGRERVERICRETLDIYAPLAHRLGIARWKWELEDHAFRFLHPAEYREMASHVAMQRREREAWLDEAIEFLDQRLTEAEVNVRVMGRPKHLYSIYQKMLRQGIGFDEVMDILAVRIVTQTVSGCYNALGIVHRLWPPVPGRFKDYIAMPKTNMYQSIHTCVMRETGLPLEIQIRTEEMDRTAREGIAAHWRYKEGGGGDGKLDDQLRSLRQMFEWLQDAHAPEELLDNVRREIGTTDVYVFTPKGEVKEFPEGVTPIDFAYNIHSDIGHHCIGARVNGHIVPLRYNLQTGDVVEVLTSRSQNPHLDWLSLVVTGRARTRIRHRLRELGKIEPLEGAPKSELVQVEPLPPKRRPIPDIDDATREKLVLVEGAKGIAVSFAKCCNPMPGQPILGYITKTPGVTIHRADCKNFSNTKRDPTRTIQAAWDGEEHVEVGVRVVAGPRPNLLADITNSIRHMNICISRAEYRPGSNGENLLEFLFEAPDQGSAKRVVATLRAVAGVTNVQIVPPEVLVSTK